MQEQIELHSSNSTRNKYHVSTRISPIEEDFVFIENIGVTRFGVVQKGHPINDETKSVIIKVFDRKLLEKYSFDVMKEVLLLKKAKSNDVAKVYQVYK